MGEAEQDTYYYVLDETNNVVLDNMNLSLVDEFENLIISWGLRNEAVHFVKECNITEEVLKNMNFKDINDLFMDKKFFGDKVLFRRGLEKWREEQVSKFKKTFQVQQTLKMILYLRNLMYVALEVMCIISKY